MKKARAARYLDLPATAGAALIAGARDASPVKGLTHGYYKYPARFSPRFARATIETFTKPGDICFDPHVGGGTTLVEAIAAGRDGLDQSGSSADMRIETNVSWLGECFNCGARKAWAETCRIFVIAVGEAFDRTCVARASNQGGPRRSRQIKIARCSCLLHG